MSVGLLLSAVLLLANRERVGGRVLLVGAVACFGLLLALDGRTLETWMWLRGWSGLGMDAASAVIDGSVQGLELAGWSGLAAWLATGLARRLPRPWSAPAS